MQRGPAEPDLSAVLGTFATPTVVRSFGVESSGGDRLPQPSQPRAAPLETLRAVHRDFDASLAGEPVGWSLRSNDF
jgi:hypothetical protein